MTLGLAAVVVTELLDLEVEGLVAAYLLAHGAFDKSSSVWMERQAMDSPNLLEI